MDLDDRALDRELAALLLEQPRAIHQLALVDLPLGSRASSSASGGSVYSPFRRSAGARSARDRRAAAAAPTVPVRRLRAADLAAGTPGRPRSSRLVVAFARSASRGSSIAAAGFRAALGSLISGRFAPFFVCFAMTSCRCCSRRRSSRHSRNALPRRAPWPPRPLSHGAEQAAERELRRQDDRQEEQRQEDDDRAGAIQVAGRDRRQPVAGVAAGAERLARESSVPRHQAQQRAEAREEQHGADALV